MGNCTCLKGGRSACKGDEHREAHRVVNVARCVFIPSRDMVSFENYSPAPAWMSTLIRISL